MLAWSTLPVALKVALVHLDPWTLTWVRFAGAAVLTALWLRQGLLASYSKRNPQVWTLLAAASAGLIGNYLFYILGLNLTTPATAQVLIQFAPVLMGLGGIWLFGERYSTTQWAGFAVLLFGM